MKKNKNVVLLVIIIVVAIAIAVGVCIILLDNKGKVNQGSFRINDVCTTSTVQYSENEKDAKLLLSQLTFSVSQKNEVEILIAKEANCTRAYLSDFSVNGPSRKGSIELSQYDKNIKTELNNNVKEVEIYPIEREDGQYLVKLNIDNINLLTTGKVPANTAVVTFDGTMLNLMQVKSEEIQMTAKFDLNLVDVTGKTTTCKFKLKLPGDELIKSGTSIVKEELSNFVFTSK